MAYTPQVNADTLEVWIGTPATGRATASSTTLDTVAFTQLPGQPTVTTFTPADVGCPIAIIGGGPVNPLMPPVFFVQGSTFVTTIAAYVSPSQVTLTAAPTTGIYNAGFCTVIVYRRCLFASDVAANVQGIEFDSSIAPGTRDTLTFTVLANDSGGYIERFSTIAMGQPIYFRSTDSDVGDIFGGEIDTLVVSNLVGTPGIYSWQCNCTSWAGIAARRQVPPANAAILTGTGDAVFAQVVLDYLNDEGVGVSATSAPAITIPCAVGANIATLLDNVVSAITAASGVQWYWYADEWRNFVLASRTATAAPWNVGDGSDMFAGDQPIQLSLTSSHDQMANFVYAIGQNVLFNALNATFGGNGSARTFNLPQPVGSTPTIQLNSAAQTVGVQGVDSGKQWYWSQGSTTITQDTSGTVLAPSDVLVVAYQASTPGVAQFPITGSLQARSNDEATSGIFGYTIQVSQPILPADLLQIAENYAVQYGYPSTTVTASTLRPGLRAGQLQSIVLPQIGVNDSYLIATMKMTTFNNVIRWDYTAFNGANVGNGVTGLVQFINRGQNALGLNAPVPVIDALPHEITIDHTKVAGSDKTDFIFGFLGTYSWLTYGPSGNVAYANGSDIYFSTTQDQTGLLDFDLAYYDSSTGQIAAWVRIPTLSSSIDTVIYILYGDPTLSSSLANPPGTWSPHADISGTPNANYHGVYHLGESVSPYSDASKYTNTSTGSGLTGYPTRDTGPFGYAQFYGPLGYGIALPSLCDGDGFNNFNVTLEAWVNFTGAGSAYEAIFDACNTTSFDHGVRIATKNSGGVDPHSYPYVYANINGGVAGFSDDSTIINDGAWHWLVVTQSLTNFRIYCDGALIASAGYGQNFPMGTDPVLLGCPTGAPATYYQGSLAECRAIQIEKDADTIATEWANTHSPSTFYSVSFSPGGNVPGTTTNVLGNPMGTVTHSVGALTSGLPVLGNGGGDVKVGVAGQLVPAGGTTGQALTKTGGTDYATGWATITPPVDDIQINGATTLNTIQVNATQVWQGQTEIQFNGTFI